MTIILVFIFVHVFTLLEIFAVQGFFISTQRTPFSIFCRAYVVIMNSLSFCLSGNTFISISAFKHSCQMQNFHLIFMSSHCLLASQVPAENLADNLIEDAFCVMYRFFLGAFTILSVFSFYHFNHDVSRCWVTL